MVEKTFLIALISFAVFIALLKVWNKYAREYNYRILRNSKCQNCSQILGNEALEPAVKELEKEQEIIEKTRNASKIKVLNMTLICPNCGAANHERDLYRINRANRKKDRRE